MRGNFLDVPTDCPQRDERLGWTGDIQVFAPTAAFLYDCAGFLTSWLRDLAAEQRPRTAWCRSSCPTSLPPPDVDADEARPRPGATPRSIVPWVLYQRFGDRGILADAVRQHARLGRRCRPRGPARPLCGTSGFQFGDWLDPAAPPDEPGAAATDRYLVATAYLARSAELRRRRRRRARARATTQRATRRSRPSVRAAFAASTSTPTGRLTSDAPTAYALALEFELLPDEAQRGAPARGSPSSSRDAGYRIAHGLRRHAADLRRALRRRRAETPRTACCCSASARRGSTR